MFIGSTAKNGFEIRIVQQKIHNIKEKNFFDMTLKENNTETSIDGNWISKEIDDCITKLSKYGFKVRALVSDNQCHSSNVKDFSNLLSSFSGEQIFIHHSAYGNLLKTYIFYDGSHHQKCTEQLTQFEKVCLSCL